MLKISEIDEISKPFEVMKTGRWIYKGEPLEITSTILANIADNFNKVKPKAPTKMVIDYNHGSAGGDNPEAGKAAGWIHHLYVDNDILYAYPEWTETAKDYISKKEYRYASAEIDMDYHDKEKGNPVGATLLAVALTNRPFIEGQEAIALAEPTREELQKEAESRSKKYGIKVRDDGHLTIPSEYSDCKEGDFADPVNYMYPCNTDERAMAAYKYFSKEKNRNFYSAGEISKIEGRIKSHLPEDIAKNAFKGDEAMDDVKTVVELTEKINTQATLIEEQKVKISELEGQVTKLTEAKSQTDDQKIKLSALETEVKNLTETNIKINETLKLAEANEWINMQFSEHKLLPKEKETILKLYLTDNKLAKEFIEKRGVVVPIGVNGESIDEQKSDAEKAKMEIEKIRKYAEDNKITFPEARVKLLKEEK